MEIPEIPAANAEKVQEVGVNDHPLLRAKRERLKIARWKRIFPYLLFLVVVAPPIVIFVLFPHNQLPAGVGSVRQLALLGLVKVQGWSLERLDLALSKNELTWLAAVAEAAPQLPKTQGEALDLPDWLATRLAAQQSPEQLESLMQALNQGAPLDLRRGRTGEPGPARRARLGDRP